MALLFPSLALLVNNDGILELQLLLELSSEESSELLLSSAFLCFFLNF